MELEVKNYLKQKENWPKQGKHIMAQYDESSIVVYQAYRPSIGLFAAKNQYFGGEFSYSRMSWIKPNFLWMMYRCGWASKQAQEVVLAIRLKREFFDSLLVNAVPSQNTVNLDQKEWNKLISHSDVRLQWDPDHDIYGNKEDRRAIQLGLRNSFLEPFSGEAILSIEDISEFVRKQKELIDTGKVEQLEVPLESVYPVSEKATANLGMT